MSEETKKKLSSYINISGIFIFICMFALLVALIFTDKDQTTINKTIAVVSYVALSVITGKKLTPTEKDPELAPTEEETDE